MSRKYWPLCAGVRADVAACACTMGQAASAKDTNTVARGLGMISLSSLRGMATDTIAQERFGSRTHYSIAGIVPARDSGAHVSTGRRGIPDFVCRIAEWLLAQAAGDEQGFAGDPAGVVGGKE